MRPIEFRFWNTKTKCMYADTGLTSLGLNDAISLAKENNYEIMQFTGLLDKNRKKIFEGDICRVYKPNSYLDSKNGNLHVVAWDSKHGRWHYANSFMGRTYQVGSNGNTKCVVVGNIYEKPDLLK